MGSLTHVPHYFTFLSMTETPGRRSLPNYLYYYRNEFDSVSGISGAVEKACVLIEQRNLNGRHANDLAVFPPQRRVSRGCFLRTCPGFDFIKVLPHE